MAVAEPMNVAPPTKAPKSRRTGSGCHWKVSGIANAISVTPLKPGRNENTMARRVPATGYRMFGQEKTIRSPSQAASATKLKR